MINFTLRPLFPALNVLPGTHHKNEPQNRSERVRVMFILLFGNAGSTVEVMYYRIRIDGIILSYE
jgi:hypothetical protein